ncbi:MAG: MIP/aquaporin family protein [Pyrinomonadaceae bacterium]
MKKLAAEFAGTFALVFAGTGAIIINDLSGGAITHVGISLTFGLIVFAMICALGSVSGAHLNPAVTAGFFLARRFPARLVLPYITSQFAGAILASAALRVMFMRHQTLGVTIPAGSNVFSFILEIVLSGILMFVILSVSSQASEKGLTAAMAIGAVIALAALFGGPISGASMNPARSLAPALLSKHFAGLWIYLTAPLFGAALAVPLCRCVQPAGCCSDVRKNQQRGAAGPLGTPPDICQ